MLISSSKRQKKYVRKLNEDKKIPEAEV